MKLAINCRKWKKKGWNREANWKIPKEEGKTSPKNLNFKI
jgi:hypothetical protein